MRTKHLPTIPILAVLAAAALVAVVGRRPQPQAVASGGSVSVYFSPDGGCTEAIVAEIQKARTSIRVQAYSFTSAPIARALVDARKRGVDIVALLDKSQRTERYSSATFLDNQGVPVFIDATHAIAHNKIILIDDATIITGSFNFTAAAEERNAENLLVLKDNPTLIAAYAKNFQHHLDHAEKFDRPASGGRERE